jgi:hypothetical protein
MEELILTKEKGLITTLKLKEQKDRKAKKDHWFL